MARHSASVRRSLVAGPACALPLLRRRIDASKVRGPPLSSAACARHGSRPRRPRRPHGYQHEHEHEHEQQLATAHLGPRHNSRGSAHDARGLIPNSRPTDHVCHPAIARSALQATRALRRAQRPELGPTPPRWMDGYLRLSLHCCHAAAAQPTPRAPPASAVSAAVSPATCGHTTPTALTGPNLSVSSCNPHNSLTTCVSPVAVGTLDSARPSSQPPD